MIFIILFIIVWGNDAYTHKIDHLGGWLLLFLLTFVVVVNVRYSKNMLKWRTYPRNGLKMYFIVSSVLQRFEEFTIYFFLYNLTSIFKVIRIKPTQKHFTFLSDKGSRNKKFLYITNVYTLGISCHMSSRRFETTRSGREKNM